MDNNNDDDLPAAATAGALEELSAEDIQSFLRSVDPSPSELENLLFGTIQKAVSTELLGASNYVTRATVYLRVLKRITDYMGIPWSMIQDLRNLIPVHSDCLKAVECIWQCQQRRLTQPSSTSNGSSGGSGSGSGSSNSSSNYNTTLDESNTYEKFLSRDYARSTDLIKLISVLFKREANADKRQQQQQDSISEGWKKLYHLLAVDGFSGPELKNYWEALRYPFEDVEGIESDYRWAHVYAVRKLYRDLPETTPELVQKCLTSLFENKINDDPEEDEKAGTSEGPKRIEENAMRYYSSLVKNQLQNIRRWKFFETEQYLQKKNSALSTGNKKPNKDDDKRAKMTESKGKKRGRQPKCNLAPRKEMKLDDEGNETTTTTTKKERPYSSTSEGESSTEEEN